MNNRLPYLIRFKTITLCVFLLSFQNAYSQDLILEVPDNRISDYNDYETFASKKIDLDRNFIEPDLYERYKEIQEFRADYYTYLVKNDFFTWRSSTYFYVKNVFDSILISNPKINKNEVRLLLSRSRIPNAYSIGDGTIIINIGLIDFFNNDDQIAFVLCHELAHYLKEHSKQKILSTIKKEHQDYKLIKKRQTSGTQFKKVIKSDVYDERRHQRVFEFEADAEGLALFRNTNYSLSQVPSTILQLDLIDSISYQISQERLLEVLKIDFTDNRRSFESDFSNDDVPENSKWNSDSLRTHPACSLRSERLKEQLSNLNFTINDSDIGKLHFNKMNVQAEMIEYMMYFEQFDLALLQLLDNLESNHNKGYSIGALSYTLFNLANYRRTHILNYAIEKDEDNLQEVHIKLIELLKSLQLDEISNSFSDVILDYYNDGYKSARMLYSLAMLNKFAKNEELHLKFKKELEDSYPGSRYKVL